MKHGSDLNGMETGTGSIIVNDDNAAGTNDHMIWLLYQSSRIFTGYTALMSEGKLRLDQSLGELVPLKGTNKADLKMRDLFTQAGTPKPDLFGTMLLDSLTTH